jgi:hypothetical protein
LDNPYQPPSDTEPRNFSFADLAVRTEGSFVYRELKLNWPLRARLRYSGWNFLQRVWIDDQLVWKRISWVTFYRQIQFVIPKEIDPRELKGEILIDFGWGLRIRRMTVTIENRLVYEELNP